MALIKTIERLLPFQRIIILREKQSNCGNKPTVSAMQTPNAVKNDGKAIKHCVPPNLVRYLSVD